MGSDATSRALTGPPTMYTWGTVVGDAAHTYEIRGTESPARKSDVTASLCRKRVTNSNEAGQSSVWIIAPEERDAATRSSNRTRICVRDVAVPPRDSVRVRTHAPELIRSSPEGLSVSERSVMLAATTIECTFSFAGALTTTAGGGGDGGGGGGGGGGGDGGGGGGGDGGGDGGGGGGGDGGGGEGGGGGGDGGGGDGGGGGADPMGPS